jgi:hypothetical protein
LPEELEDEVDELEELDDVDELDELDEVEFFTTGFSTGGVGVGVEVLEELLPPPPPQAVIKAITLINPHCLRAGTTKPLFH